jgi:hypothetical protein
LIDTCNPKYFLSEVKPAGLTFTGCMDDPPEISFKKSFNRSSCRNRARWIPDLIIYDLYFRQAASSGFKHCRDKVFTALTIKPANPHYRPVIAAALDVLLA